MTEEHKSFINRYSRIEQIALLLSQVRDFSRGKKSIIPPSEFPNIIQKILKNESKIFYLNYSFGYFGILDQLVTDEQYENAIKAMVDLMGFYKKETKDKVKSLLLTSEAMFYGVTSNFTAAISTLKKAVELDRKNTEAWRWLEEYYQQDGNFELAKNAGDMYDNIIKKLDNNEFTFIISEPEEEFKNIMEIFVEKREVIRDLWKKPIYKKILHEDQGILNQFNILLNDICNFLSAKDHIIPKDSIKDTLDDIINVLLEWMSIISSVSYFKLKYNLGNKEQIHEIAAELLHIIGWEDHVDLKDKNGTIKSPLDLIYRDKAYIDNEGLHWYNYEEENAFIENSNSFDILVKTEKFGNLPVHVTDYEVHVLRNNIIDPDDILISDESIKINFTYPLSLKVEFTFNNKGGFTRIDLFRCIYEGYKKIYEEEAATVGDPGRYKRLMNRRPSNGPYGIWGHYMEELIIERINYDPSTNTLNMLIGS